MESKEKNQKYNLKQPLDYLIGNRPEIIINEEIGDTFNDSFKRVLDQEENKIVKNFNKKLKENSRLLKNKIEGLEIENAHLTNT